MYMTYPMKRRQGKKRWPLYEDLGNGEEVSDKNCEELEKLLLEWPIALKSWRSYSSCSDIAFYKRKEQDWSCLLERPPFGKMRRRRSKMQTAKQGRWWLKGRGCLWGAFLNRTKRSWWLIRWGRVRKGDPKWSPGLDVVAPRVSAQEDVSGTSKFTAILTTGWDIFLKKASQIYLWITLSHRSSRFSEDLQTLWYQIRNLYRRSRYIIPNV